MTRRKERTELTRLDLSSGFRRSLSNRVLNGGNSLRWHHEIFKWLDEWVGEDAKDVATVRAEREERVASFQIQK